MPILSLLTTTRSRLLSSTAFIRYYAAGGYNPELVADFVRGTYSAFGKNTATELLDHTRNGNATMTDSSGNIVWAPHNLLTYSEDFSNAAWSKTATTVTPNAAVAPDGTQTADEISHTSTSAQISQAATSTDGVSYTVGIYVKYVDHQWFRIFADIGSVWFDIQNGVVGSTDASLTGTLTDIGSGWYYLTIEDVLASGTSFTVIPLLASADLSTGETVGTSAYIWGAHVYRSDLGGMADVPADERAFTTATKYVPTTDAARYLPRVNHHAYNGSQWVNKGLLVESEARTNLEPLSEDYSGFASLNLGSRAVDATGPDGEISATTVVANSAGGTSNVAIYNSGAGYTVSTSTAYTFSAFLKAGTLDWAALYTINFTTPATGGTFFDLTNGVVGTVATGHTATIENVGNGWYRCAITFTTDAADTSGQCRVYLADGDADSMVALDGASSILVYGLQFEAGSTPSSYLPTNGATVTRPAESITIPAANLPWPTPQYVTGEELVTNGTFDTDTSGWTSSAYSLSLSSNALQASYNGVTYGTFVGAAGLMESGKVYQMTYKVVDASQASNFQLSSAHGSVSLNKTAGTHTVTWKQVSDTTSISFYVDGIVSGESVTINNISVKEINPLALSIQMSGEVTGDSYTPFRWYEDSNNYITQNIGASDFTFTQADGGTVDSVTGGSFTSGVSVAFNFCSTHASTLVAAAVDGTSLTDNTTPVALTDLSSTDVQIGYDFNGTIDLVRIWSSNIAATGREEAST